MGQCVACHTRPAIIKMRGLCFTCYQRQRRCGTLAEINYEMSLRQRYGDEIIKDYTDIATSETTTLASIGVKYGFTRERARQIFKELFGYPYTGVKKKKRFERERERVITLADPNRKIKDYKQGSLQQKGAEAEVYVYKICTALGYKIESGIDHKRRTDLVVNGLKCEIKSADKTYGANNNYYHFSIIPSEYAENDFFILHIPEKLQTFIMPKYSISNAIYIPTNQQQLNKSKYKQYLESWHLLCQRMVVINNQEVGSNVA